MTLYSALRPLIYLLQPEQAHALTIAMLRVSGSNRLTRSIVAAFFRPRRHGPAVSAFGLSFSNPLGMAAGYDKDGFG
jgi:dihydroorotate dehydrogenase